MVKIGVIGAGRIGKFHAETLVTRVPKAEVIAIADYYPETAQRIAQQLKIPLATGDYGEILSHPAIDAVVIASSTDTHAQFIAEAAKAGKHIFCEKPIDFDLGRIDAALDAVEQAGVKLQIGFNRRFDPNHARIKQAIENGEIGEPHLMHIISRDPAPPPIEYIKVSGGIFFDMTIHDFDMARFLLGEVEEIYTAAGVMVDPKIGEAGDVDTAVITLKFANGVIGTIDNSRRAVYGYDQRVEVFGSKGSVKSDNLYADAVTVSTGKTVHTGLPLNFFMERYTPSYVAEMQAFINCIVNDTKPLVTGYDGRVPVAMGMAALQSYRENRPVRVDSVE
jgi:myo-inositol 2-dehydrogenase/D-chiro-inositol 1-dehydrogenase